jgi:hypothetical protein
VLRRLEDEPFAIPDATFEHIAGCARCRARRATITRDAAEAARRLGRPQPVPDVDRAWVELQSRLAALTSGGPDGSGLRVPRAPGRFARVSVRTGVAAGVVVAALAGTAAAATLSGVFAPTRVAPVPVSVGDVRALAGFMDLADGGPPGGFPTRTGTGTLPFGSLRWSSTGSVRTLDSRTEAEAVSGVAVALPAHVPSGVGSPTRFVVQPRVSATITFDAAAGSLDGATATLDAGPAVFVEYGPRSSGASIPTLGILTMPRPTGVATGASLDQIESFLLSRPGIPADLATEIRLLGDVSTILPVPTPPGVTSKAVHVGRWPGVVLADRSGVVSGVVWEDGAHVVHAVGGLVDQEGVLGVARQLG